MKYYAVKVGKVPGIYTTWPECQAQVSGYSGAIYKGFGSREDAEDFIRGSSNVIETAAAIIYQDSRTIVYTDGSSQRGNGGYGIVCGDIQLCGRVPPASGEYEVTNNRAELYAILTAILTFPGSLEIRTDSTYSIGCLTAWYEGWVRNGFRTAKGTPVENRELIVTIKQHMEGRDIRLVHVRAHSGHGPNELADSLADRGAQMPLI